MREGRERKGGRSANSRCGGGRVTRRIVGGDRGKGVGEGGYSSSGLGERSGMGVRVRRGVRGEGRVLMSTIGDRGEGGAEVGRRRGDVKAWGP